MQIKANESKQRQALLIAEAGKRARIERMKELDRLFEESRRQK